MSYLNVSLGGDLLEADFWPGTTLVLPVIRQGRESRNGKGREDGAYRRGKKSKRRRLGECDSALQILQLTELPPLAGLNARASYKRNEGAEPARF
jgi:hypothetical protein